MVKLAAAGERGWDGQRPDPADHAAAGSGLVEGVAGHSGSPIRMIFEHAAENAGVYRLVLRVEGAFASLERLRNSMSSSAAGVLQAMSEQDGLVLDPQVPPEIFSNYFAAALLGAITWWLESDNPYGPPRWQKTSRRCSFMVRIKL